ncbi:hypothetical protein QQX98_004082 [Neonectria punicea]|uniref:Uncharacterized protein n=1 Tax=Neonectria punicea TaxID=979145 RepID=A0ABR1HBJ4_9HYPO
MSSSVPLDHLPALTSPPGLGLALTGLLVFIILLDCLVLGVPYPKGIALVREPEGSRLFSFRTRFSYYTDCEAPYRDAYTNVSLFPHLARELLQTEQDTSMARRESPSSSPAWASSIASSCPPELWVIAQPDAVLSTTEAFANIDRFEWGLGDRGMVLDAWAGLVIKRDMNRVLEAICAAMNNELQFAFEQCFDIDRRTGRRLICFPQLCGRFTVGLPLCRNEDYLWTVLAINQELVLVAGVARMTPRLLCPIVGTLAGIQAWLGRRKMSQ